MTSSPPGVPLGLRERKKMRTRAAIREAAMRLFEEQGYAATTVEQIAEAAEVSPSTFFRYFPTKEDTILTDDYDAMIVEAIRAQPRDVSPVRAVLRGMRGVFENLTEQEWAVERRRQRLIETVPDLRVRQQQQTVSAVDMLAAVIAERDGRPADEDARVVAGALVGIVLAVSPPGTGFEPHDFDRLERALAALKDGLSDF
ncbi:TetR/AcrR family transcriptional regulator [Actinoplanes sp. CA-054009]